jgi:hypothetical protein
MPEGNFLVNVGGCLVLLGAAVTAVILVGVFARRHRRAELAKARQSFEASLAQLRKDPKSADLRREALHHGEFYSKLSIGRDGRPAFDEEALQKALRAACPQDLYPSPAEESLEEKLEQLARYRQKGLISEEEYRQKRSELVAETPVKPDPWGEKIKHG